jgi:hypothetical protein
MSDNLNQIMASGYPQGSGSSAKYVFTCYSCGGQVVTRNDYSTGVPGTMSTVLSGGAQTGLSRLMRMIPVIGPIMSSIVGGIIGSGISNRQVQGMQGRQEEAKRQAFEEVRSSFSQCTRCGAMACPSCFSGGLCRTCRQTAQVQQNYAGTSSADQKGMGDQQYGGDQQKGSPDEKDGGQPGGSKDPTKMWE